MVFLLRRPLPTYAQTQVAFDSKLLGSSIHLTADGTIAEHIGQTGRELGGIVFCSTPIHSCAGEAYFEVCVEGTRTGHQVGIVLGFCNRQPDSQQELPKRADDLPSSWSYGYDGGARTDGIDGVLPIEWNPKHLRTGDCIGLLARSGSPPMLVINRQLTYSLPGRVPMEKPLYAFIDLLGNTRVVSIVPGAKPPSIASQASIPAQVEYEDRSGLALGEDDQDEIPQEDLQTSGERDENAGVTAVVGTSLGIPFLALAPLDPTFGFLLVSSAVVGIISWATTNHPTGRQH